jgi:hypothetical protein
MDTVERFVIPTVCVVLLAIHISLRWHYGTLNDGLDAITLGLAVTGLSPWIAAVIQSLKIAGVEVSFREVEQEVRRQGLELRHTKFLLSRFIPESELRHLLRLSGSEPFLMGEGHNFQGELQHLFYQGLLKPKNSSVTKGFLPKVPPGEDIRDHYEMTDIGRQYLAMRLEADKLPE